MADNPKIPCFECDGVYDCILDNQEWRGRIIKNVPIFRCPKCSHEVIGQEGLDVIEEFKKESIDFCLECGAEMVWNVPRSGSRCGFVHKDTGKLQCTKIE